jgi:hypothetical protein
VEALLSQTTISYLVLGEYHGTQEMPAAAAEIACAAARPNERVVLALEISSSENASLQALINGEAEAAEIIGQSQFWQRARDGRSSAAMMQLLLRVRELRQQGLHIDVVAVDAPYNASDDLRADIVSRFDVPDGVDPNRSFRDYHMAASMIDEASKPNTSMVLLLVGNYHAFKEPFERAYLNPTTGVVTNHLSVPTAAALPPNDTITVLFTHSGGTAYTMSRNADTGTRGITPTETCATRRQQVYSASLCGAGEPPYDMHVYVGEIHSSPPATEVYLAQP